MATTFLRDKYGRVIGFVEEGGALRADYKQLRSPHGVLLGYYDKRTDTTYDSYGRVVGRGDVLTMLIDKDR